VTGTGFGSPGTCTILISGFSSVSGTVSGDTSLSFTYPSLPQGTY